LVEEVISVPELGYVIRMFPHVSETFIANEILSLERLGVPLRIYSYRRPREDVQHEVVRLIQSPITYLPDPTRPHLHRLLAVQFAIAKAEPARYRNALRHVVRASLADRSIEPWKRLLQSGYLAQLVRQDNIGRLHAHFAHGSTHVAMLVSMLTGLPFSFSAHARDIYDNASPRLLREKIAAAELVVTCTQANQKYLRSMVPAADGAKISVAYHGADLAKFAFGGAPAEQSPPTILSVGRLVAKKGYSDLLRACRVLADKAIPFRCMIVGEGPERGALEMQVRALGLEDRVTLIGACTQEELVERYRQATVFALPCIVLENGDRDGIPNVLVEAMASGVPVVSTGISGIPELIRNGDSGLLVPAGNTAALAAAIALLLSDRELRHRLVLSGRAAVAEHFDSSACARRLAVLFGLRAAAVGV
jgi:glycosyltransferase involved in cell wall biosynthesis